MSEGSVSSVLLCHHCNTVPPVWTTKNAKEVLKTESAIFFTLFLISDSRNEAKTENLPYAIKKNFISDTFSQDDRGSIPCRLLPVQLKLYSYLSFARLTGNCPSEMKNNLHSMALFKEKTHSRCLKSSFLYTVWQITAE